VLVDELIDVGCFPAATAGLPEWAHNSPLKSAPLPDRRRALRPTTTIRPSVNVTCSAMGLRFPARGLELRDDEPSAGVGFVHISQRGEGYCVRGRARQAPALAGSRSASSRVL
jgi:hypothetical protein